MGDRRLLTGCAHALLAACRCAAEATNTVTAGRAATQQGALEKEVAALRQQVRECAGHSHS